MERHVRESACDMRGFLSFLILWLLHKREMSGAEIATELERRKGCRPNPGTLYPALKELVAKKAIAVRAVKGKEKIYGLTPGGRAALEQAKNQFCKIFYDVFTR